MTAILLMVVWTGMGNQSVFQTVVIPMQGIKVCESRKQSIVDAASTKYSLVIKATCQDVGL